MSAHLALLAVASTAVLVALGAIKPDVWIALLSGLGLGWWRRE